MKVDFYRICSQYSFTSLNLQHLADKAEVDYSVVYAMFKGNPVKRSDAEGVLATLNTFINGEWDLNNTKVPLMPYYFQHILDLGTDASTEVDKLAIISHLKHRAQEQMLIFYTREPLRADEQAALFQVLHPKNCTLDICIDQEWIDDK